MRLRNFGAAHAALVYTAITLWATWPLARGLTRDVAWDLGDPVLVIWAIAWNCSQLLAILGGDVSRLGTYFDANIFAPAPNTLAYSEHFVAQAVQALPVYAVTGNAVLCYNLLYLSTFVLSGLGAFLLVRELTGSRVAGFVAGLLFAFAPYRFPQSSHLQVLSSHWMPLALYAFRRYFDSGRPRALVGAVAALVAQNLSCGYYMLYFSPFAAAYVLAEIAARGLWRSGAVWRHLAAAAIAVLAVTVPFFLPYLALREVQPSTRALAEVSRYSADVYSYATAFADHPIWGRAMQAFPKPEGQLFPGVSILLLAAVALVPLWSGGGRMGSRSDQTPRDWKRRASLALGILSAVHAAAFVAVLAARRLTIDLGAIRAPRQRRNSAPGARHAARRGQPRAAPGGTRAASGGHVAAGGVARRRTRRGVAVARAVAHVAGTAAGSGGTVRRPLRAGARLRRRARARAVLDGRPAGAVGARRHRRGASREDAPRARGARAGVGPLPGRGTHRSVRRQRRRTGARFQRPRAAAAWTRRGTCRVRRRWRSSRPAPVLAELPLGQPDFDLRAMFYSTFHWRKLRERLQRLHPAALRPPGRLRSAAPQRRPTRRGRRSQTSGASTSSSTKPPTRTREAHASPRGCARAARGRCFATAATCC